MLLDKYLTEYDENLSGETYIDPLGMLVIWSEFGRKIFKNRVNSIANDVRNYTLNLFNHYLIRLLIQDESVTLKKAMEQEYRVKDCVQFKNACLVYLENLFVYSIVKHESDEKVDSSAVLGIVKARRLWNDYKENPPLKFTHDSSGHILVRQLSLGVSGRYKTPMVEIGYFDANYNYQMPKSVELWAGVKRFIESSPKLKQLSEVVYEHIESILAQNKLIPETSFKNIPESLHKNYVLAFASAGVVGQYARNYWLQATGLNTGAAGAIMQVLDENAANNPTVIIDEKQLISLAKKNLSGNREELIKMEQIELLEPFLADVSLLFILLTSKKSHSLKDVTSLWEKFDRNENSLPSGAMSVLGSPAVLSSLSGTAFMRLSALLKLSGVSNFQKQITLLIEYHKSVMEGRGQYSWLGISDDDLVQVQARPSRLPECSEWQSGCWFNNYYIPQFKFLVNGYQGRVKA